MGTHLLHLPLFATPLNPIPSTSSPRTSTTPTSSPLRGRHHHHVLIPIRRFRFSRWYNAESDDDDDFEFGFGSSAKKRNWWSDDDWEVDEDDDDDEFWGFKALKAFGWIVPAVAISLLLGTGPNAFLMALAVPLGQTVLSLAFDKMWGTTVSSPKPRRKRKSTKKPFGDAARTREKQDENWESNGRGRGNSRSRSAASFDKSVGEDDKNVTGFGGWDELDDQVLTKKAPGSQKGNGSSKQQKGSKLSRRGRVRETPLLLRLLVAVFPFLGSWTKLLL